MTDEHSDIGSQVRVALGAYRSNPVLAPLLTEPFIHRMEIFGSALALWGAKINLTARPQDPAETAFHIADSLMPLALAIEHQRSVRSQTTAAPSLRRQSVVEEDEGSDTLAALSSAFSAGKHILDVGAGAGFPGLVLASACPAYFSLAEARHKRASFLKVAAAEIALDNVEILAARLATTTLATSRFDAVLSRASGPVADFYAIAASALTSDGLAILYANPSQRLELKAANMAGLVNYRRYNYSLHRGADTVKRVLVIWRAGKKAH